MAQTDQLNLFITATKENAPPLENTTPFSWCLYIPGSRSCSKLVDNAIHWINLHPVDNAIGFPNTYLMIVIYPLECTIERLNNRGLEARREVLPYMGYIGMKNMKRQTDPYGKAMKK